MTTSFKKSRHKKILALCLSSFMLAATAASFVACGDGKDSSVDDSEVSTTENDTSRITNGSFEFFEDDNGRNLIITSPTGWSKSTGSSASGSASSSQAASGIIDTSEEAWKNLTTSSGLAYDTESEAKANWDNLTAKDKLDFYDKWEEEDDDNDVEDLDFYDKDKDNFNIDIDDVPDCENPLTHYAEDAEDADKNDHVLMLHNTYSNGMGTAQKYTSSTTVTLEPGTSAIFSVWVKTLDMTYNGTKDEAGPAVDGNRGAYIGVTHTVGGTTLDQMEIKNIDTSKINAKPENGEWENNGWVEYTISLKGCSYASSTFTIVLGLGQGGGTDKFEYVDGYAFFDDAECTVVSNETYDEQVKDLPEDNKVDILTDSEKKIFEADKSYKDQFEYAIDLSSGVTSEAYDLSGKTLKTGLTEEKYNGVSYVSAPTEGKEVYGDLKLSTANDLVGRVNLDELKNNQNKYVQRIVKDDFENYPFDGTKDLLMLLSADGASYTATLKDDAFTLAPDSYLMLSFWLKTSDIGGFTGAGITVRETGTTNATSLSSLDTTSITTVDIDGEDGETIEDIYDGWQQCFLFVKNETDEERSFEIDFTYGPTTIVGTTNDSYYAGYAAFANFEICDMTKKMFSYSATDTYAQSVSLTGDSSASASTGFDSPASIPDKQIENGLAVPKNYKGVNGGSGYVVAGGADKEVNGYEYAGLINKKYAANYRAEYNKGNADYWLNKLAAAHNVTIDDQDKWWNELFGTATQPLLVYNDAEKAYGYIGSSQTISSGSYATVSVKVKVSKGAKAYIYLVDTTEKKYSDTLSLTTPKYSYWYDDDGNICAKDPSDKKFDKKTDIAFYLNEENGLYEANTRWSGYTSEMSGKFYANLSNYEKDDEGNLIVADGGVSYNYDDSKWKGQGKDGIAFYHKDGKYYAYKNYTTGNLSTEVLDLATIEGLARYTETPKHDLMMTVDGDETNGEWVTCTFYIHTGNEEKNYRLEVWSGDRTGETKSAEGSYVVFDANTPDAVDDKYSSLVDETIERIKNDNDWTTDEEFKEGYKDNVTYYTYSFYDSPLFLRYDSTLDKDEVGNKYTSYMQSSYTEGVAYLYYEDSETAKDNPLYTMFVDYSYTEVSVTADSTDTDDSTDDTTDDTNDMNMWLLISSLVIAIALFIAMIGLLVQKLVKKFHLKKAREGASNAASLNAAKRRYSKKPVEAPAKQPEEKPENKDDNDPYND